MNKLLFLFTLACIINLLTGCETSEKAIVVRKYSRQPKFINGIYMNGHNKTSVTVNAIDPKKYSIPKTSEPEIEEEEEMPIAYVPVKTTVASKPVYTAAPVVVTKSKKIPDTKPAPIIPTPAPISLPAPAPVAATDQPEDNDYRACTNKYAEMIGLAPRDVESPALFSFIEQWYGTNYKLGGCDISGVDCSGFVRKLYSDVYGVDLLRTAMEQFQNCKRIKKSKDAEEGDLVFFHVHSRRITHVGIYLANDYFVHASSSQGVMISNLKDEYWHKYFAGCGRIPRG